jgi:hypothetical protein
MCPGVFCIRPGDRRSMIDGDLPSDQRSPRSGSKEHAAVNSAAADQCGVAGHRRLDGRDQAIFQLRAARTIIATEFLDKDAHVWTEGKCWGPVAAAPRCWSRTKVWPRPLGHGGAKLVIERDAALLRCRAAGPAWPVRLSRAGRARRRVWGSGRRARRRSWPGRLPPSPPLVRTPPSASPAKCRGLARAASSRRRARRHAYRGRRHGNQDRLVQWASGGAARLLIGEAGATQPDIDSLLTQCPLLGVCDPGLIGTPLRHRADFRL